MSWRIFFGRGKKPARDSQIDSELRFHIDALTEENIAAGMSPAEARRQAQLEFGGREQIKEELRDVYRVQILDAAATNLKAALRFLRKSPSFSIAVILTLALGIGANSAVFSAIDAILLKPLPFPDGDQLVKIGQSNRTAKTPQTFVAPVRLEDWNRMNTTFQAMTGYYTESESETTGELPEKVTRALVAPRFLQVWGVAPALGRDFTDEESHVGGPNVVIISDRYWRNRFGADPQILTRKIRMGSESSSIVGVMPASFHFPERDVDMWSPIPVDAKVAQIREATWYFVVGRMKSGVTIEQARANLATVQAQLGRQFPKPDGDLEVLVDPLKETTVGGVRIAVDSVRLGVAAAAHRMHEHRVATACAGHATAARNRGALFAGRVTRRDRGAVARRIVCSGAGRRRNRFVRCVGSSGHFPRARGEFAAHRRDSSRRARRALHAGMLGGCDVALRIVPCFARHETRAFRFARAVQSHASVGPKPSAMAARRCAGSAGGDSTRRRGIAAAQL
jgi:hypothetical protein